MTAAAWVTVSVTAVAIACLVLEIWPAHATLIGAIVVLMAFGVIEPSRALAPFGSVAVISVAALLVVAAGVRRTGIVAALADRLYGRTQGKEPLLRVLLPTATLSAFMNNTPIVAMFVPAVLDWCKRNGVAPSRLLMPLSFATILGGMCTLIGTSTTLVVDGLMRDATLGGMTMFEISAVGIPAAVAGLAVVWLLGPRVLPDRRDPVAELGEHRREYLVEMLIDTGSPMAGLAIFEAGLRNLPGLFLTNIERRGQFLGPVGPNTELEEGDRLVFAGVAATVVDLRRFPGLSPAPEAHYDPTATGRRDRLFEAVVSASSPLVGTTIKDVGFRSRYDAAVLAVHRAGGGRVAVKLGEVVLRPGDTLMIEAAKGFDLHWANSLDFSLISRVRAEPLPQPRKAGVAALVLGAMVLSVTMKWVPIVVAALLAVGALLAARVLTVRQAQRAVDVPLVMVLAGAIGLGQALESSGAARALAEGLLLAGQAVGPLGVLAATYLCAAILTELVTNVAAAAVVFPIAMATAQQAALDPRPFAIAVAIAASASFLTPTGYQTNLMVYGPGGYRFSDFARLGAAVQLAVFAVAMLVIPRVWPLFVPR